MSPHVTDVPPRRGATKRHAEGRRSCDHGGGAGVTLPPEADRDKEVVSRSLRPERGPAEAPTSDFWPQGLRGDKFPLF